MRYSCGNCGLKFRWVRGEGIAYYTLIRGNKEEKKSVDLGGVRCEPHPLHCPECQSFDIREDNI